MDKCINPHFMQITKFVFCTRLTDRIKGHKILGSLNKKLKIKEANCYSNAAWNLYLYHIVQ